MPIHRLHCMDAIVFYNSLFFVLCSIMEHCCPEIHARLIWLNKQERGCTLSMRKTSRKHPGGLKGRKSTQKIVPPLQHLLSEMMVCAPVPTVPGEVSKWCTIQCILYTCSQLHHSGGIPGAHWGHIILCKAVFQLHVCKLAVWVQK